MIKITLLKYAYVSNIILQHLTAIWWLMVSYWSQILDSKFQYHIVIWMATFWKNQATNFGVEGRRTLNKNYKFTHYSFTISL